MIQAEVFFKRKRRLCGRRRKGVFSGGGVVQADEACFKWSRRFGSRKGGIFQAGEACFKRRCLKRRGRFFVRVGVFEREKRCFKWSRRKRRRVVSGGGGVAQADDSSG